MRHDLWHLAYNGQQNKHHVIDDKNPLTCEQHNNKALYTFCLRPQLVNTELIFSPHFDLDLVTQLGDILAI